MWFCERWVHLEFCNLLILARRAPSERSHRGTHFSFLYFMHPCAPPHRKGGAVYATGIHVVWTGCGGRRRGIVRFITTKRALERVGDRSLYRCLFYLCVQKAIDKVRKEVQVSMKAQGERTDMLKFADDMTINTERPQDFLKLVSATDMIGKMEEDFNTKTTKWMSCSKTAITLKVRTYMQDMNCDSCQELEIRVKNREDWRSTVNQSNGGLLTERRINLGERQQLCWEESYKPGFRYKTWRAIEELFPSSK